MANNKIVLETGEVLIDLTNDTVNSDSLISGYTAHAANGAIITGNVIIPTKVSELINDGVYLTEEDVSTLLNKKIQSKTVEEWYEDGNYVPDAGEFIIFSDYKTMTNENGEQVYVPSIKIGDGVSNVVQLPFITSMEVEKAKVAEKLEHSLTIGTYVFDGSSDVEVPVYTGIYS